MEFYDVIEGRFSYRGYKDEPIKQESLDRIARAVSLAPTACNLQPFEILVVLNDELRSKIAAVYPKEWLAEAPAIVVAIGDSENSWQRLEGDSIVDVDMGIVLEHLVLAAQAEGLGTCWICAYDRKQMDSVMGLSGSKSVIAITPLGYPKEEMKPEDRRERKPIEQIFKVIE